MFFQPEARKKEAFFMQIPYLLKNISHRPENLSRRLLGALHPVRLHRPFLVRLAVCCILGFAEQFLRDSTRRLQGN